MNDRCSGLYLAPTGLKGGLDRASTPDEAWLRGIARSSNEPQPACQGVQHPLYPHLRISSDAWLTNKRQLIQLLGGGPPAGASSDDCLILAAYAKWGERCPEFLLGEFAFAIWDQQKNHLFCCRDHLGIRPFFYWQSGQRFLFGSDPESILSAPGVPRELNKRKLAGIAVFAGRNHYDEDTYHVGIFSLPAAAWLRVNAAGIHRQSYWEPRVRPELIPAGEDNILAKLRDLMSEAVRSRLDTTGPAAALLSGGLDSSAIVALALRELRGEGRDLLAVSATVPDERRPQFRDEREFVEQFRSSPNLQLDYVTSPDSGPFDGIEDPSRFTFSPWRNPTLYLYEALGDFLLSRGVKTVLEGDNGELGPTFWGGRYYIELATRLKWLTLSHELRKLKEVRGVSPLRAFVRDVRDLLFDAPARHRSHSLFTPAFLRENKPSPPWRDRSINHRRFQVAATRQFMAAHSQRRSQNAHGQIRVTYPLLDKNVVEFCIAAPGNLKVRNGYPRYLVRGALDGILPPKIQWRPNKLVFSPDYNFRYNAQFGKLRDFVESVRPGDPIRSVVDVDALSRMLHPIEDVTKRDRDAITVIPGTVYTMCFLRQFAEFR